jgi:hypothetical protein
MVSTAEEGIRTIAAFSDHLLKHVHGAQMNSSIDLVPSNGHNSENSGHNKRGLHGGNSIEESEL